MSTFRYSESMENGTRLSLFALPTFAYTIANAHPERKGWTLADIGAGPTVYSAICFRDVVDRAYLADYLGKLSIRILLTLNSRGQRDRGSAMVQGRDSDKG